MLPSFLIIGAMKAATTTLFRDLGLNPEVFVPEDKEPDSLTSDGIHSLAGMAAYRALFARARPGQCCGEASTAYTKRPRHEGVALRARRVLGADLKLIYLIRDPVDRIISQHHHWVVYGLASANIDEEVRSNPEYLAFSRYAWQLEPWLAEFPRDQICILKFEDYMAHRRETVDHVSQFIGVSPRGDLVDPSRNYNPSSNRRIPRGKLRRLARSPFYRRRIRPLLSWRMRELARSLLPRAPSRPPAPSADTAAWLTAELADDVARVAGILGKGDPPWDRWRGLLGEGEAVSTNADARPSAPEWSTDIPGAAKGKA